MSANSLVDLPDLSQKGNSNFLLILRENSVRHFCQECLNNILNEFIEMFWMFERAICMISLINIRAMLLAPMLGRGPLLEGHVLALL